MLSDQLGYPINIYGESQGLIWFAFPWAYSTGWGHEGAWTGVVTCMVINPSENWQIIFFFNYRISDLTLYIELSRSICQYAHLFGNIYALRPSVDETYARKNIDPILFRTRFSNIYNHQFTPHLIWANTDSTQIDSLTLFDDGLRGDSLANDGIYGDHIPPQQNEDYYFISVSTIDLQTSKYFKGD